MPLVKHSVQQYASVLDTMTGSFGSNGILSYDVTSAFSALILWGFGILSHIRHLGYSFKLLTLCSDSVIIWSYISVVVGKCLLIRYNVVRMIYRLMGILF
jgi:hypothetical protein